MSLEKDIDQNLKKRIQSNCENSREKREFSPVHVLMRIIKGTKILVSLPV